MPKESKPNSCRKPFKSLEEQLDILKSRGLLVFDEGAAIECLHRNGYYRLSACWYPFYDVQDGARVDIFRENSHFEDAANLCVFDKDFKLLLLSAIERIEIAARVEIARCLGKKDAFAYLDPKFFKSTFTIPSASSDPVKCTRGEQGDSECALAQQAILSDHESWLLKYENAFDRSKEVFVRHHKENHGESEPLPVWIAIELWDFGLLSQMYKGLVIEDAICVSERFQIPQWGVMTNWLHALNNVRNIIAHHGRLWNISPTINPKSPSIEHMPEFRSIFSDEKVRTSVYAICCILAHFTKIVNTKSSWNQDLVELIESFPIMPHATITNMGFPEDWRTHSFWQ